MTVSGDQQKRLLDFVGDLYDAAADPSKWPALAVPLAKLFNSESALVTFSSGSQSGRILTVSENFTPKMVADYADYYYANDMWRMLAIGAGSGNAIIAGEHIPDNELVRTELYADWTRPMDIGRCVGGAKALENGIFTIGIHRSLRADEYNAEDKRQIRLLLSHFARAIDIEARLSSAQFRHEAALEGLERTATATIAADRNGQILFANKLADALLRQGMGLRASHGRLVGTERETASRLAFLIRAAADMAAGAHNSGGGGMAIGRGEGRLPVTVLVSPFRPKKGGFGAPMPAALIFIRDPEAPSLDTQILQDLFGFTPAQATIASRIADGDSLEQISHKLNISWHTARDHLKAILAKTGTSRQTQLVALLLRTVSTIRP